MLSPSIVAQYFVNRGIQEGKPLTQMKLQKMVYFAHGYHLAIHGEPLISGNVQAWRFGPVIPGLYQEYKIWGNNPIIKYDTTLNSSPQSAYSARPVFSEIQKDTLNFTWEITKDLDAFTLSNWSHEDGAPWDNAVKENSSVIENDDIKKYFKDKLLTEN